jgi:ATP-dependent protease ClpP protease subunit
MNGNGIDISEITRKYGTSLKEMRRAVVEMNAALPLVQPTGTPKFLTSDEAKTYGVIDKVVESNR